MSLSFLRFVVTIFCLVLAAGPCFSLPTENFMKLRAVHVTEYDRSFSLQPRDKTQYSKLDVQTQGELLYASAPGFGSHIFANMTLYAPEGLLMVLLEHFDHLTSAIDCQGDDGTLSLTFNSQNAFDYALQAWGYVNANADGKFLLIANHNGCGPDEERQPYIIASLREDSSSLTTYLAAEPAPWSDVAGTYDLDFGHVVTAGHLEKRHFWDHDIDFTKTKDIDEKLGHENKRETIYHDSNRLMLDCVDCFATGHFHLMGHIKANIHGVKEATMSASLKGFKASLQLQAAITKIQKIEQMSNTKELFSAPVPELGIELPHIFKLGLTFAYQVGFSTKVSGTATVIFGATASIPDDAVVTVDLNNPHKSSWTGFEGADVSPVFDVTGLSANVKFAVFSQADLAFGIDLHDKARFDVELNLKIPQLSTTISAGYKEAGWCSQEDGASKTGASIFTAIGIELWLEVVAKWRDKKKIPYSYKFFNITKTLDQHCLELPIPDLTIDTSPAETELLALPTDLIPTLNHGREEKHGD